MGLCKCPRKKVTNLFCFEHRVNVCEFCLNEEHSKCIVQSYLSWLSDSDYDANCLFCSNPLNDPSDQCIRLPCLHLFHFECFNQWAEKFPPYTAPAGFTCPSCKEPLFPKPNSSSPIDLTLRNKLQEAEWARTALGLSFSEDKFIPGKSNNGMSADIVGSMDAQDTKISMADDGNGYSHSGVRKSYTSQVSDLDTTPFIKSNKSKLDMDNPDVKYKRRSAFEWLGRWLNSKNIGLAKRTVKPISCRRLFFYTLLFVIGILTLVTVLTRNSPFESPSSLTDDENDPFLDPEGNPLIRNMPLEVDQKT
uniref:Zinc finger protein-like 1 homolog n=1 Tax=Romanomermis culicivorax TaxID=13658 RepID=A0A915IQ92_ROMCU